MAPNNKKNVRIDLHHLTRVEGHGNILVDVSSGVLEQCDLEIVEAPRFFEAMLRGMHYEQASHLASRICGICAVTHATVSLRAVEKAFGVENSQQTNLLRLLNLYGEMMDSHTLHVYMLAAPDLFGVGSVIPLARSSPDVIQRALRMKKLFGDICAVVCGRHTHPIAMMVGGFTHLPSDQQLLNLHERLLDIRQDVEKTVELFQSLAFPDFERDTEYIALRSEDEYCLLDGVISSTDGGSWPLEEYKKITNEFQISHSSAKHARNQRQSYMVGALARVNINQDKLHDKAYAAASALDLLPKCTNPYLNTKAQVVEIVHCVERSIEIIQTLLKSGINQEEPVYPDRISGEGVGACEAPRGTLFHDYRITNGIITAANCVIPTAQNLANIEMDMRSYVPSIINLPKEEVTHRIEMLVRAYDPCISCATHTLEVKFV